MTDHIDGILRLENYEDAPQAEVFYIKFEKCPDTATFYNLVNQHIGRYLIKSSTISDRFVVVRLRTYNTIIKEIVIEFKDDDQAFKYGQMIGVKEGNPYV